MTTADDPRPEGALSSLFSLDPAADLDSLITTAEAARVYWQAELRQRLVQRVKEVCGHRKLSDAADLIELADLAYLTVGRLGAHHCMAARPPIRSVPELRRWCLLGYRVMDFERDVEHLGGESYCWDTAHLAGREMAMLTDGDILDMARPLFGRDEVSSLAPFGCRSSAEMLEQWEALRKQTSGEGPRGLLILPVSRPHRSMIRWTWCRARLLGTGWPDEPEDVRHHAEAYRAIDQVLTWCKGLPEAREDNEVVAELRRLLEAREKEIEELRAALKPGAGRPRIHEFTKGFAVGFCHEAASVHATHADILKALKQTAPNEPIFQTKDPQDSLRVALSPRQSSQSERK